MKINTTNAKWIEISIEVMMFGMAVLSIGQEENDVEVTYTLGPDGISPDTSSQRYEGASIGNLMSELSEKDYDISYDEDEEAYFSNINSDYPGNWSISFGKDSEVLTEIYGTDPTDETLLEMISLLKEKYPFASAIDGFFRTLNGEAEIEDEEEEE